MDRNYEKAYKAVLKTATQWIKDGCTDKERICLESVFPELRESEDERIRKWIVNYLHRGVFDEEEHPKALKAIEWLEKQKDASKATEAVERIDKYIDEHLANAHDMKDSNPDKKYYRGWGDALGKMAGILQDVYSGKKQKESLRDFIDNFPYSDEQKESENTSASTMVPSCWEVEQKEPHFTKRNALFYKCVENCDPKTVEEVNKRVDDIMNMSELSAFEQALTNFIGDWQDDEERWPSKFVKKHGKHILDMAREELQKEHQNNSDAPEKALGRDLTFPHDKDKNLDEIAQDYVDGVKEFNPEPTWDLMQTAVCYGYHYCEQKEQEPAKKPSMLELLREHLANTPKEQLDAEFEALKEFTIPKPAEWSEDWREEDIQTRFAFYTYKDDSSVLYLSNVFVEEASRNHGFGTRILRAAEKVAETIGAITICLKVKQDSPANAWYRKNGYGYVAFEDGYDWLEKNLKYLKPKKSIKWSGDDELMIESLIAYLKGTGQDFISNDMVYWLKSLPERFNLPPKQEWSEEDERILTGIIERGSSQVPFGEPALRGEQMEWLMNRLKSLRNRVGKESLQPHWKPSEEQMRALLKVVDKARELHYSSNSGYDEYDVLRLLYKQLKEL